VEGTLLGALTRAKQVGHSCLPRANIPGLCCCCCHAGRWAAGKISLIPELWEIGDKIPSPRCTQTLVLPSPDGDINYQTNQ